MLIKRSCDHLLAGQVPSNRLDNNSGIDGGNEWLLQRALHSFLALLLVSHPRWRILPFPWLLPGKTGAMLVCEACVYIYIYRDV